MEESTATTAPNLSNFAHIKFTPPRQQPPQYQHLTCTLLNIQSLGDSTKTGAIQDLITWSKVDALAPTETWLANDPLSLKKIADISPPGYCFHHHPLLGCRSAGVGTLVRKPLNVKLNHNKAFASFEHINFTVSTGKTHLHIILVYRPSPPPSTKNKLPR